MNIYELGKQATPGLVVCDAYGEQLGIVDADEPLYLVDAVDASTVDMQLLAHCRNNFLKALEALKAIEAQSLIDYRAGKQTSGMCSTVATVIQTIKELEEV